MFHTIDFMSFTSDRINNSKEEEEEEKSGLALHGNQNIGDLHYITTPCTLEYPCPKIAFSSSFGCFHCVIIISVRSLSFGNEIHIHQPEPKVALNIQI